MAKIRASMNGGGGGGKVHAETVTIASVSGTATIDCGFAPKHIAVISDYSTSSSFCGMVVWDEANDTRFGNTNTSNQGNWRVVNTPVGGIGLTITSTGFTIESPYSGSMKYHVFAIG